jgi:hypothetical protein
MATEEIAITTVIAVGGYVGTKLFGTALATMGDDINSRPCKTLPARMNVGFSA